MGCSIALLSWYAVKDSATTEVWVRVLLCLFAFGTAAVWPSVIVLSDAGVEERRWWRPRKLIPWAEVTAVQANRSGDRAVFGRDGQCICLDRYHVDHIGFEFEVRRRAGLKETLHAEAPLSLGLKEYPPIPVGLHGRHKMARRERKLASGGKTRE